MIKSNTLNFFRTNPNETVAYPCGCGYVTTVTEYRGNHGACPNCGGDELNTRAFPQVTIEQALEQEPLLFSEENA